MDPNLIYPYLEAFKDEMEAALPNPVGRSLLVPGVQAAWDDCCQGQLALRILNIQVRNGSPRPVGCKNQGYTFTLGASVIRCAATVDDRGKPPSVRQIEADAFQMTQDMTHLQKFLECEPDVFQIINWVPQGPDGGCHGGEWTFTIRQDPLGCCDDHVEPIPDENEEPAQNAWTVKPLGAS